MVIENEVHSRMAIISNFNDWMMNKSDHSALDGIQKWSLLLDDNHKRCSPLDHDKIWSSPLDGD